MRRHVEALFLLGVAFATAACASSTGSEAGAPPAPTLALQSQVQPGPAGLTADQLITIARNAIRDALKHEKDKLPVVGLDDDRFWTIQTEFQTPGKWRVSWGGNPAGGGYHGDVVIEKASGRVDSIHIGRHLR